MNTYDAISPYIFSRVDKDSLSSEFKKARQILSEAIESNNKDQIIEASHLLGSVYEQRRDYELAYECFKMAGESASDQVGKARAYRDMAICLYQEGKYEESQKYLNLSIRNDQSKANLALCTTFLCWTSFYGDSKNQFKTYYDSLIKITSPILNDHYKEWIITTHTMYCIIIQDYDRARKFLSELSNEEQKIKIEEVMCHNIGDYDKAIILHDRSNDINDSIRNLTYDRDTDEVSMLIEAANGLSEYKAIQKKNIIMIEGVIVILLIMLLVWMLIHYMTRLRAYREQEKLNTNLRHEKERAARLEKMQSLFIANMSREIQTPLRSILVASDNIISNNGEDYSKIIPFCDEITAASSRMLKIIDHIFTVSSAQSSDMPETSSFPIAFLINSILSQTSNQLGFIAQINCSNRGAQEITANYTNIINVVSNILTHMVSASGNGNVSFCCETKSESIDFSIECKGDESLSTIIGNAFEQIENDNALNVSMLELSSAIIQAKTENCKIWQDNKYKGGARIIVSFPAHTKD